METIKVLNCQSLSYLSVEHVWFKVFELLATGWNLNVTWREGASSDKQWRVSLMASSEGPTPVIRSNGALSGREAASLHESRPLVTFTIALNVLFSFKGLEYCLIGSEVIKFYLGHLCTSEEEAHHLNYRWNGTTMTEIEREEKEKLPAQSRLLRSVGLDSETKLVDFEPPLSVGRASTHGRRSGVNTDRGVKGKPRSLPTPSDGLIAATVENFKKDATHGVVSKIQKSPFCLRENIDTNHFAKFYQKIFGFEQIGNRIRRRATHRKYTPRA
ncbi:hypothetical protein U1Q18_038163 [Sarracenia purpurea var. burkii]